MNDIIVTELYSDVVIVFQYSDFFSEFNLLKHKFKLFAIRGKGGKPSWFLHLPSMLCI